MRDEAIRYLAGKRISAFIASYTSGVIPRMSCTIETAIESSWSWTSVDYLSQLLCAAWMAGKPPSSGLGLRACNTSPSSNLT
jgi:hypothetical protein